MPWPLLALAIAAFGIGTTEFVPMGLLPELAADLDVSIPRAGLLVSGYALGVTFGAPLLAIATARMARKTALLGLMGVFLLGNLLCALAPGYTLLLGARLLTSLCHGAFFGIGSVVAAGLAPPGRRGQAVSLMFTGLTLSNILGVPFGAWLGQAYGWRMTFWAIVPIGVAAAVALALMLPAPSPSARPAAQTRLLGEFAVLRRRQVLLAMSMSTLMSSSLFTVFTYVAPTLRDAAGVPAERLTLALLLFGVAITIGNLLGGRLADWRPTTALIGLFAALALAGALLPATLHAPVPAVLGMLAWGCISFAPGSALQTRVVDEAFEAPNLAATLNQSAFNLGNAIGAWTGAAALSLGAGYTTLPWLAALFALAGMGLAIVSAGLSRQAAVAPAGAD